HADAGRDGARLRAEPGMAGIRIRPEPESDVGRRCPAASFRLDPGLGTSIERVRGDELLFTDGRSRHQPYLTVVTAKTSAVSFRITGCLIPPAGVLEPVADLPTEIAAEQGRVEQLWRHRSGAIVMVLAARSP